MTERRRPPDAQSEDQLGFLEDHVEPTRPGIRQPESVVQNDTVTLPKSWLVPVFAAIFGAVAGGGGGSLVSSSTAEKMLSHQQEMYELKLTQLSTQVGSLQDQLDKQNDQIEDLTSSIIRIEAAVAPRYGTSEVQSHNNRSQE